MKPEKFLSCMFLFPFLAFDRAQNSIVNVVYSILRNYSVTNRNVLVTY